MQGPSLEVVRKIAFDSTIAMDHSSPVVEGVRGQQVTTTVPRFRDSSATKSIATFGGRTDGTSDLESVEPLLPRLNTPERPKDDLFDDKPPVEDPFSSPLPSLFSPNRLLPENFFFIGSALRCVGLLILLARSIVEPSRKNSATERAEVGRGASDSEGKGKDGDEDGDEVVNVAS